MQRLRSVTAGYRSDGHSSRWVSFIAGVCAGACYPNNKRNADGAGRPGCVDFVDDPWISERWGAFKARDL